MKKRYKIKITPTLLKKLRKHWAEFEVAGNEFYEWIGRIEESMAKDTGIEDIEFIKDEHFGGEWIGIGNESRTMPLTQREELE